MFLRALFAVPSLFLAIASASAAEMTFKNGANGGNCNGCEWSQADGEITADTAKAFLAYAEKDLSGTLYINSAGGDLLGALRLGEAIRSKGISVMVGKTVADVENVEAIKPGSCRAACVLAFMGGTSRGLEPGSDLTLVRPDEKAALRHPDEAVFLAQESGNDRIVLAVVNDHAMRMGLDPRFLPLYENAAADGYAPNPRELADSKLVYDPSAFARWQVEPYKNGLVAFARTADQTGTLTLFCEGSARRLLYARTGAAADASLVTAESGEVSFLGASIAPGDIVTRNSGGTLRLTVPLPAGFEPKIDPEEASLSNSASTSRNDAFTVNFGTDGLKEAVRLAFRNCI